MITIKPDFYDKFKCIASKCTDSCCVGWEIDIDKNSFEKYQIYRGQYGDKIRANISCENETACFKLKGKEERCPFLNEENLCDIIINCGEDMLCDICREHPRFYEWYDNYTDMGLGLCCEEAVRLLLKENENLNFLYEDDGSEKIEDEAEGLLMSREKIFNILKNKEQTFYKKIHEVILITKESEKIFFDDNENQKEIYDKEKIEKEIFKILDALEPFDENYTVMIKKIKENRKMILEKREDFDKYINTYQNRYEKILSYTIFRYYMKCLYDGNIMGKIAFSLIYIWLINMTDMLIFLKKGKINEKESIDIVKYWSKQIDYSEENVDILMDEINNNQILSCKNIEKLFKRG